MNFKSVNIMLDAKHIYIFLLMCSTHLSCSLGHRYNMDTSMDTEGTSEQSSSRTSAMHGVVYEGDVNIIHQKVNKFLEQGEFKRGSTLTNEDICSIFNKLDKKIAITDLENDYKEFLNQYGSIYGSGLEIFGPMQHCKNNIEYASSFQSGFEDRCKSSNMTESQVKYCWLIGYIDNGDEYYINFSKNKKGYIYSLSSEGVSRIFANSFSEFLDKLFEQYEIERSEEDVYEKINKFNRTKKFQTGLPISDPEIGLVLQKLGKNIDPNDLPREYIQFLNKYGSISGEGFEISGPLQGITDKIQYFLSIQQEFEDYLKINTEIYSCKNSCWVIAKSNEGNRYYINTLKKDTIGFISCIDGWGNSIDVSNNFLEFLDKFFAEYKKSTQR